MPYLAHSENAEGKPHLLNEHLQGVGELAACFAQAMNPTLSEAARWAGLLHDLGKYRDEFQEYLRGARESSTETHHAVYGAAIGYEKRCLGLAFAIAGHHAGLHDGHKLRDDLINNPKYQTGERLAGLKRRFAQENGAIPASLTDPWFVIGHKVRTEFYIRMLFSALVDADFLDTEAHYTGAVRTAIKFKPDELLQRLIAEKETKSPEGELNAIRNQIFQRCLDAAEEAPGFFSLTVPTGGGKTLAGMAFALRHAQRHGLRRVIAVIPYLSIIEQNAAQYRRIFDPAGEGVVVEHHSAVVAPEDEGERRRSPRDSPLQYAAENWDAPVIVTTSVQFIESLFASKTTRCRKLHNVARSVVVFDEVQTLPPHLLNPLLNVLRELRENYGVSFVFSTATQPAFSRSLSLPEGFAADEVREITRGTAETFKRLRRVKFHLPKRDEAVEWPPLAEEIARRPRVLCVVNTRRHAFELWSELSRAVPADERGAIFHLSSAMCAQHRFDVLGAGREPAPGTIRHLLRESKPCRVVSTQLVEAGVDLDFPCVYRALGPLDSIVQAAGRCNREGRLLDSEGRIALGEVIVFRLAEHTLPPGTYRTATDITATLLERAGAESLATSPALFADYFGQLYDYVPTDFARAGECSIQDDRAALRFREVARKARVISEETNPVVVPYREGKSLIEAIRLRPQGKGRPRFNKRDLQSLQRYMVNLRRRDFDALLALRQIEPLLPNLELYVLREGLYDERFGVVIDQRPTGDFLL